MGRRSHVAPFVLCSLHNCVRISLVAFGVRICEKGSMKEKQRKLLVASDDDDARPGKGDKLNKCNIHHSDGAKYMSYLKISKKQHQLVKIMKQSGKSIRSKSLNCVLGDLDTLHVQPYEEFVKEEQKKLQEYWMQLANKDLPVAYAIWRERQFQRQEISKSLEDELKGQLKYPAEYLEKDGHETLLQDQSDQCAGQHDTNTEDKPEYNHETVLQDPHDHGSRNEESGISDYGDSDEASPHVSEYSGGSMHVADASIDQGVPFSSGGDVWPAVSIPNSYYDPTSNHEYASTGILPLPHQVNEEQCSQLIDVGSGVHEEETGKDLLHRQSDDGSFRSYPNHDRSGLLQSLFRGQYTGHNQGQLQSSLSLEQRQKNHIEDYTHQNITEDIYSEGGGFLIPRQGHAPLVNLQDWNSTKFAGDWNGAGGVGVSNQSIGSNADQSLFSVLSQCNQLHITSPLDHLRSGSPTNQRPIGTLDSVGSAEQFMLPRTYGMASGVTPRISNALPQAVHPLDYLSGRDSASSLMADDIGWMTLPQNSALHDPLGETILEVVESMNILPPSIIGNHDLLSVIGCGKRILNLLQDLQKCRSLMTNSEIGFVHTSYES
ncbi:NFRKB-RELATED [Salix koriyanagi]|uniref:NFRKB-RELATED n=1 Tax=Salix koriyanagi TaxID=2511006 RepID=A0A9Q0U593_9ROSI|nr:NFRKB-RELATED [Salix koriyanagi]